MAGKITATDAARKFSELLNQVRYQGEEFDIVRGKEVVARLRSQSELAKAHAGEPGEGIARPGSRG